MGVLIFAAANPTFFGERIELGKTYYLPSLSCSRVLTAMLKATLVDPML